jgi:GT2 family glycosyltransferase
VDPEAQLRLAETLREHREHLDKAMTKLSEGTTPLTKLESQLLNQATLDRVAFVMNALEVDARARIVEERGRSELGMLRAWLKRLLGRARGLKRPKIGRLNHHPPKPLRVPAGYFKTTAPTSGPTISIVTPSFQQGRFIGKTIASVLHQNYPALEYVVQDGGSTDETPEILHSLGGLLTSWASGPDDGQADAINRGFHRTTGEIMGWINSDDILLPGALAYIGRFFASHPDVDVVYGNRIMIDDNDCEIGVWILPAHDDKTLTLVDYVPQETLFWRRKIWESTGGYVDKSFGFALDWDLLLRFRDVGARMVHVPRFLGGFRVHDEQKTSSAHILGTEECARLRQRVHGRALSIEEVVERVRPYLRRHVLVHNWHRLTERLPQRRVPVRIQTLAPRLETTSATADSDRMQAPAHG